MIGYVSTATVIALSLGLGYLWQSGQMDDRKLFRMVALLHDVDIEQLAEEHRHAEEETPPEEMSLDDDQRLRQVLDRNYEVKQLALEMGRQQYDHRLEQIKERTDRYNRLAEEWETRLKQEEELTTKENVAKVVSDLEQLKPKPAKDQLMRWIEEGRVDDVIRLMGQMSSNKLGKILKSFQSEEEKDKLYHIHRLILEGYPDKPDVDSALQELTALKSQK